MNYLKVNLWGKEIGRLVWDSATRRSYFMYNPALKNEIADIAPLLSPLKTRNVTVPIYGDDNPLYQGLPPFIADSLPDSWGNTLFDKWVKDNKIARNKVTPLYKLMFIGSRGMGALEYEPCAQELTHGRRIDILSLYGMSLRILEEREESLVSANDELTLQALLAVGTSAGGRQMKAIIAINNDTHEIRSGQTDCLEGFDYYILKFGDNSMPIAEIEAAYHKMAHAAGIKMEESRLLSAEGVNHFLTKRFDRKNGKKIHVQTLAAMNPEARSYEDLIETCRILNLPESQIEQVFARLAFNVIANNTDDHNKNFSFLLEEGGEWKISPAYDMTFIFNANGTGPNLEHRFSVAGKTREITKADLLEFAKLHDIKNGGLIIDRTAKAVAAFEGYAEECGVGQPWRGIIKKTLDDRLAEFGYIDRATIDDDSIRDKEGRMIGELEVSVNSRGYYEVSAMIKGRRHRKFVRPNMPLYAELTAQDIYRLPDELKFDLIATLFPKE